jgi:hypothetical protein
MNKLALAMCIIIFSAPQLCLALDNVVISEVIYDPVATETGGEAVELYNPTNSPINIGGYTVKTESTATDATIPAGTMLAAKTFYLIADAGWSNLKDNASWPNADHEEAITLANADAGVAIVAPNGTIIDAVGWGNVSGIGAGLYEGTPAMHVTAGKSLRRTDLNADTDINSADFSESAPDFQNSSTTESGGNSTEGSESLQISVEVTNNAPTVESAEIITDDDTATPGSQIIPVPEGVKDVVITAELTDPDGISDIQTATATITGPGGSKEIEMELAETLSSTSAVFNATVPMQFYDTSGIYTVTITASDASFNITGTAEFEYLSMTAISIDSSALLFDGARPGGIAELRGDYALSTTNSPTIRNTGNTAIDVGLYGTDLADGTKAITVDNMKYSFDNDFGSTLAGTMAKTLQTKTLGLENGEDSVISLGFQLSIPTTTQNGNYTGQVTVVAMSS